VLAAAQCAQVASIFVKEVSSCIHKGHIFILFKAAIELHHARPGTPWAGCMMEAKHAT
jgi:hypothetical protein